MLRAFQGSLPDLLIRDLIPGDTLFVQTLHSFPSWLIMYLTKSEVTHVATYIGGRRIVHATLAGTIEEPLDNLFSPDTILFACSWRLTPSQQESAVVAARALVGRGYGWPWVIAKGIFIMTGRDPLYFRGSFLLDLALLLIMLTVPFIALHLAPLPLYLFPLYALVVGLNFTIARFRPLPAVGPLAKPVEILMLAWAEQCDFYLGPDRNERG